MKVDSDLGVNSRPALCARPAVSTLLTTSEILSLANQLICVFPNMHLDFYERDVSKECVTPHLLLRCQVCS